jgi:DNA uptake protein ComE-like DNA-binding protein
MMTKHLNSFLQGLLVAGICALWYERRRGTRLAERTSRGAQRAARPLLDLNQASPEELASLPSMNRELVDRIIESRPYRNKLDLISRLVIAEETYELIKRFVYVPPEAATEPVKVAG